MLGYRELNESTKIDNLYKKATSAILRTSYGVSVDFYELNAKGGLERVETISFPKEKLKEISGFFKKNICSKKVDIDKIIGASLN